MRTAHLDEAHVGDIEGAWGTIRLGDTAVRRTWIARLLTLRAYLLIAVILLVVKVIQLAIGH